MNLIYEAITSRDERRYTDEYINIKYFLVTLHEMLPLYTEISPRNDPATVLTKNVDQTIDIAEDIFSSSAP